MSAVVASPRQLNSKPSERVLKPLPSVPRKRSNVFFVFWVVTILGIGMAGAIILNTVIEQQSRVITKLQHQSASLTNQKAILVSQVNEYRSPRVLALKASDLKMVPNAHPAYIDLRSGKISGNPSPVRGDEVPTIAGGLQ